MKKIFTILFLALALAAANVNAQCTDLFISEYVEGSFYNKAIEIYNPTASPISLDGYVLRRYRNGSSDDFNQDNLSTIALTNGTTARVVPAYGTFVVVNGIDETKCGTQPDCLEPLPALLSKANALSCSSQPTSCYPSPLFFNGDDAVTLEKTDGSNRVYIDIAVGKIGEAPGDGGWSTAFPYNGSVGGATDIRVTSDHTLIRRASIRGGVTANPNFFNTMAEWDTLGRNDFSNVGTHACVCDPTAVNEALQAAAEFSIYPNPAPASGMFFVKASGRVAEAVVYDVLGGQVAVLPVQAGNNGMISADLAGTVTPGIYFIRLRLDSGAVAARKVVVR